HVAHPPPRPAATQDSPTLPRFGHLDVAVVGRVVFVVIVGPQPRLALGIELGAGGRLRVHALVVGLAALVAGGTTVLVETRVGAARRGDEFGGRGERGLPVE